MNARHFAATATVTAILFEIGRLLIGLVGMASLTSAFGAAGSSVGGEAPAPPPPRKGRPL
jgi:hypothetical protein